MTNIIKFDQATGAWNFPEEADIDPRIVRIWEEAPNTGKFICKSVLEISPKPKASTPLEIWDQGRGNSSFMPENQTGGRY